jgi:hypothetical protein
LCTSSPSAGEETGLARCRRRKNTPLPFFTFCSYLLKLYHYLIFLFPQSKLAHTPFSFFSHCCLKTLFFFFSSVLWRGVLGALTEEMRASSLLRFVYGRERLSGGFRPLSFSFSLADLGGLLIALCFCWFKAEKKKERLPFFFFPLLLTAEGGKEKEQMSSHHLAARRRTPFHFFFLIPKRVKIVKIFPFSFFVFPSSSLLRQTGWWLYLRLYLTSLLDVDRLLT